MESVPVRANTSAGSNDSKKKLKKPGAKQLVIGLIILAVLAIGAVGASWAYKMSTGATIDTGKYQAVFFTNGQVYFGKLSSLNGGYMKLTDIYYLQAQASQTNSDNPQQTSNQAASDVQLIKLGNEVHGPVDEMIISKDQVLFFENLKNDGKVTQSISKYKAENKK
jgi:hypothetical protein